MKSHYTAEVGKELRAMFPEQTKSIPVLIVWTVIYLLDVALVVWLCFKLGLDLGGRSQDVQMLKITVLLLVALGLFRLETWAYNKIVFLFR